MKRHKRITWEPGTVLVPAGNPSRENCITVEGYDGEDMLAFPTGGGFQLRIRSLLRQQGLREWTEADATMTKVDFCLDCFEGISFEGYDNGDRWNGWACPILTEKGFEKLRVECNKTDDEAVPSFIKVAGKWNHEDTHNEDRFPLQLTMVDGEQCYNLNIGWCFELCQEKSSLYNAKQVFEKGIQHLNRNQKT
tara:strand:- start:1626 stop:2204 length:579 start_codon:yes stop_codon:yes gene_type:complete